MFLALVLLFYEMSNKIEVLKLMLDELKNIKKTLIYTVSYINIKQKNLTRNVINC